MRLHEDEGNYLRPHHPALITTQVRKTILNFLPQLICQLNAFSRRKLGKPAEEFPSQLTESGKKIN